MLPACLCLHMSGATVAISACANASEWTSWCTLCWHVWSAQSTYDAAHLGGRSSPDALRPLVRMRISVRTSRYTCCPHVWFSTYRVLLLPLVRARTRQRGLHGTHAVCMFGMVMQHCACMHECVKWTLRCKCKCCLHAWFSTCRALLLPLVRARTRQSGLQGTFCLHAWDGAVGAWCCAAG